MRPPKASRWLARSGALNHEMVAAGVRIFVGGLQAPCATKALRRQSDGSVLVTDGLHLNAGEHVCGFWVLEAASPEAALEWGRKASIACRASIEVRPLH
jgi:hypothetical protein